MSPRRRRRVSCAALVCVMLLAPVVGDAARSTTSPSWSRRCWRRPRASLAGRRHPAGRGSAGTWSAPARQLGRRPGGVELARAGRPPGQPVPLARRRRLPGLGAAALRAACSPCPCGRRGGWPSSARAHRRAAHRRRPAADQLVHRALRAGGEPGRHGARPGRSAWPTRSATSSWSRCWRSCGRARCRRARGPILLIIAGLGSDRHGGQHVRVPAGAGVVRLRQRRRHRLGGRATCWSGWPRCTRSAAPWAPGAAAPPRWRAALLPYAPLPVAIGFAVDERLTQGYINLFTLSMALGLFLLVLLRQGLAVRENVIAAAPARHQRDRAQPPRRARPSDRPQQPHQLHPLRRRLPRPPAQRPAVRGDVRRPRRLQAHQRQPRPRHGRPGDRGGRPAAQGVHARPRPRGAARRRRVRRLPHPAARRRPDGHASPSASSRPSTSRSRAPTCARRCAGPSVSPSPSRGDDAGELLRRADIAMYAAKARGKGLFGIFEPSMHVAMYAPLERRADLERAAEEQRVHPPLPAGGRRDHARHGQRRGAHPLAAPPSRPARPRRVHRRPREGRPDGEGGRLGARGGMPSDRAPASRDAAPTSR